ncbi:uncharacterized protein ELE39_001735 [Cryptosporidium sp. chipmunk genotype I]|uniref:uncharacterized protein n=1 Tax=Cryptosporidium sp. chipmunk genotype I TaxID=1280935 RepID=UPI00351A2A49|nr:hypothetical protein ELE39_001735 [Cryptosporidium sp. chipmunk genotype I]
MNDKFVLEVDRNDNLVEFVSYILSSKSSSVPKLSLPILDKNYDLPQFLKPERLFERHQRDKKIKFLNKCLQIAPLQPGKSNKRLIFRYSNRRPEKSSHVNLLTDKKNLNYSNQGINSTCNFNFGPIGKTITPLRERVCSACRMNSLSRHNNQKKNIHAEKSRNNTPNYSKITFQDKKTCAINELFQHLLNTNSETLSSMTEQNTKVLESFQRIKDSLKINDYIPNHFIHDNTVKNQIKEIVQEIPISLKNSETNYELHSFRKKFLQLSNTAPINLKNDSLAAIISIERLSI